MHRARTSFGRLFPVRLSARPRGLVARATLAVALCMQAPLLAAWAAERLGAPVTLPLLGLGVLAGTAAACGLLAVLLRPLRRSSGALREYLEHKKVPDLPAGRMDEAGRLMSDVQEVVARLDDALGAASAARDAAVRERHAKFDLLSKMSHELRTPLNHILGFAEILQHEMLGPLGHRSYKSYVDDIHASGSNLLGLVQAVLELSEVDAGNYEIAATAVAVPTVVEGAVASLRPHAEKAGVTVLDGVARRARLPMAKADTRALEQILRGMLMAALQSTPPGGLIAIDAIDFPEALRIVVSDTGQKLTKDDLPTVLETAVRGPIPPSAAPAGDGIGSVSTIGLGLALVYSLVKLHGGRLEIANGEHDGKSITLVLPLAGAEPELRRAA